MAIPVTVNGEARQIDAAPDTPLLWVLRDELKLTGTKFGCGAGLWHWLHRDDGGK